MGRRLAFVDEDVLPGYRGHQGDGHRDAQEGCNHYSLSLGPTEKGQEGTADGDGVGHVGLGDVLVAAGKPALPRRQTRIRDPRDDRAPCILPGVALPTKGRRGRAGPVKKSQMSRVTKKSVWILTRAASRLRSPSTAPASEPPRASCPISSLYI